MSIRLADGEHITTITMIEGDGIDYSADFFSVGSLPYDSELDAYKVKDVDYCLDQAEDWKCLRGDFEPEEGEQPDTMRRVISQTRSLHPEPTHRKRHYESPVIEVLQYSPDAGSLLIDLQPARLRSAADYLDLNVECIFKDGGTLADPPLRWCGFMEDWTYGTMQDLTDLLEGKAADLEAEADLTKYEEIYGSDGELWRSSGGSLW